jgi:hypothetical protein
MAVVGLGTSLNTFQGSRGSRVAPRDTVGQKSPLFGVEQEVRQDTARRSLTHLYGSAVH